MKDVVLKSILSEYPENHHKTLTVSYHDTESFWYTISNENLLNPFQANSTFLYPLKTSENQRFSDIFRGYKNAALA